MLDDVDLMPILERATNLLTILVPMDNWPDMEDEIFYAGVEDGKYVMTIKTNTTNANCKGPYQGCSPRGVLWQTLYLSMELRTNTPRQVLSLTTKS